VESGVALRYAAKEEMKMHTNRLTLSELLGAPVVDSTGAVGGRVREVAIYPSEDGTKIARLMVKTRNGMRTILPKELREVAPRLLKTSSAMADWPALVSSEGFLLLERDLLDQQIIDINGRKVVRVNDVELQPHHVNGGFELRVSDVDVGTRGAVRRLLKGLAPYAAVNALVMKLPPSVIPWEFVDLIETDPTRRVRLKIEHERLQRLHPADIADIIEELAPAEREAVFETLDEDVAAEALEEIDPRLQASIVQALDPEHAADIVEEMDPDAAADLLAELPEERSEQILEEMEPEEREEVTELMEFREDSAAGRMTTDYIALPPSATVNDAVQALRSFEGGVEGLHTIFLVAGDERLVGAVPLANLVLSPADGILQGLTSDPLISCVAGASEKDVAELFDKYNLVTLPVVDDEGHMTGVITADDVISLLRAKL
jgi:magnesium transporter